MDKSDLPWDSLKTDCLIFKALGHESRMAMVYALGKKGAMCVGDLQKIVGSSLPTVSRHLAILKNAGVVSCEKRNNNIFYRLDICCLSSLLDCLNNHQKGEGLRNEEPPHCGCRNTPEKKCGCGTDEHSDCRCRNP